MERAHSRFLLPHPVHRRYYLGERVALQLVQQQFVPLDPPADMLDGDSMEVSEMSYLSTPFMQLIDSTAMYSDFRAARLMAPIGSRFSSQGSAPPSGLFTGASSSRPSTSRSGRSTTAAQPSQFTDHEPTGTHTAPATDSIRRGVPPSIALASEVLDPIVASIRLPHEIQYCTPTGLRYYPLERRASDRSLPIAGMRQVNENDSHTISFIIFLTQLHFVTDSSRVASGHERLHCRFIYHLLISFDSPQWRL